MENHQPVFLWPTLIEHDTPKWTPELIISGWKKTKGHTQVAKNKQANIPSVCCLVFSYISPHTHTHIYIYVCVNIYHQLQSGTHTHNYVYIIYIYMIYANMYPLVNDWTSGQPNHPLKLPRSSASRYLEARAAPLRTSQRRLGLRQASRSVGIIP